MRNYRSYRSYRDLPLRVAGSFLCEFMKDAFLSFQLSSQVLFLASFAGEREREI